MAKEEGVLRRLLREKVGIFLEELVVLLYLPYLHRRKQYDEERTEKLLRNLVDVGITRAMHNVNVFTLGSEDPIMNDLAASFKD